MLSCSVVNSNGFLQAAQVNSLCWQQATMGDITMVEETLKRISSHKGIIGVVIVNADGIPIRSTFENNVAVQYASLASHFTMKSRSAVKQLSKNDPEEELQMIRIRSKKHEIMIAPDFDKAHEYQLIVVQNPSTS